jgi:hypothetical protein
MQTMYGACTSKIVLEVLTIELEQVIYFTTRTQAINYFLGYVINTISIV